MSKKFNNLKKTEKDYSNSNSISNLKLKDESFLIKKIQEKIEEIKNSINISQLLFISTINFLWPPEMSIFYKLYGGLYLKDNTLFMDKEYLNDIETTVNLVSWNCFLSNDFNSFSDIVLIFRLLILKTELSGKDFDKISSLKKYIRAGERRLKRAFFRKTKYSPLEFEGMFRFSTPKQFLLDFLRFFNLKNIDNLWDEIVQYYHILNLKNHSSFEFYSKYLPILDYVQYDISLFLLLKNHYSKTDFDKIFLPYFPYIRRNYPKIGLNQIFLYIYLFDKEDFPQVINLFKNIPYLGRIQYSSQIINCAIIIPTKDIANLKDFLFYLKTEGYIRKYKIFLGNHYKIVVNKSNFIERKIIEEWGQDLYVIDKRLFENNMQDVFLLKYFGSMESNIEELIKSTTYSIKNNSNLVNSILNLLSFFYSKILIVNYFQMNIKETFYVWAIKRLKTFIQLLDPSKKTFFSIDFLSNPNYFSPNNLDKSNLSNTKNIHVDDVGNSDGNSNNNLYIKNYWDMFESFFDEIGKKTEIIQALLYKKSFFKHLSNETLKIQTVPVLQNLILDYSDSLLINVLVPEDYEFPEEMIYGYSESNLTHDFSSNSIIIPNWSHEKERNNDRKNFQKQLTIRTKTVFLKVRYFDLFMKICALNEIKIVFYYIINIPSEIEDLLFLYDYNKREWVNSEPFFSNLKKKLNIFFPNLSRNSLSSRINFIKKIEKYIYKNIDNDIDRYKRKNHCYINKEKPKNDSYISKDHIDISSKEINNSYPNHNSDKFNNKMFHKPICLICGLNRDKVEYRYHFSNEVIKINKKIFSYLFDFNLKKIKDDYIPLLCEYEDNIYTSILIEFFANQVFPSIEFLEKTKERWGLFNVKFNLNIKINIYDYINNPDINGIFFPGLINLYLCPMDFYDDVSIWYLVPHSWLGESHGELFQYFVNFLLKKKKIISDLEILKILNSDFRYNEEAMYPINWKYSYYNYLSFENKELLRLLKIKKKTLYSNAKNKKDKLAQNKKNINHPYSVYSRNLNNIHDNIPDNIHDNNNKINSNQIFFNRKNQHTSNSKSISLIKLENQLKNGMFYFSFFDSNLLWGFLGYQMSWFFYIYDLNKKEKESLILILKSLPFVEINISKIIFKNRYFSSNSSLVKNNIQNKKRDLKKKKKINNIHSINQKNINSTFEDHRNNNREYNKFENNHIDFENRTTFHMDNKEKSSLIIRIKLRENINQFILKIRNILQKFDCKFQMKILWRVSNDIIPELNLLYSYIHRALPWRTTDGRVLSPFIFKPQRKEIFNFSYRQKIIEKLEKLCTDKKKITQNEWRSYRFKFIDK